MAHKARKVKMAQRELKAQCIEGSTVTGAQGLEGSTGSRGAEGAQGQDGSTGSDGSTGAQGLNGSNWFSRLRSRMRRSRTCYLCGGQTGASLAVR